MLRPVSRPAPLLRLCKRGFSTSPRAYSKFNLQKEFGALRIWQVADLPVLKTVSLASQDLQGKSTFDQSKAPVVLLHGLFGALQNYRTVGRKLGAQSQRQVIGVDLRNHGASPHAFPHDYMHMTHDAIEFIEKLDRNVILAGHSMGAKVAMLVSLLRPELVEKLVVIDNSPASEVLNAQFTRDLFGMCHVERDKSLRNLPHLALLLKVDKILLKYEKDPLVRVFLMLNLQRKALKHDDLPVKFRVPVLNFLKHDVLSNLGDWPDLGRYNGAQYLGPVKVMRGLQSDFVKDKNLQLDFPKFFPHFEVADFDCGHWLVSEQPDKFVDEMVDFTEPDGAE